VDAEHPLDPCAWRDVGEFVSGLAEDGPLTAVIHPSDEMFRYERAIPYRSREAAAIGYFASGLQILQTVREIVEWRFGGFAGVRSLLDFASGYGRVTRYLVRALSPERITVAEIDSSAVEFQRSVFGVGGFVSSADPERFALDRDFDAILAASFFSHLPERSFERWLRGLCAGVAPGGVLIFSVHGMDLLPDGGSPSPIVFRPVSETDRLDPAEYGTSYVTAEFVRAAVSRSAGAGDRLLAFPRGLAGLQDLYVLLRPPLPESGGLRVSRCPLGTCDGSRIENGIVFLEGWVEGAPDEPAPDVRLVLRSTVAAHLPAESAGPASRRRWSFTFPLSAVAPDDVVRVEARSSRGLTSLLAIGSTRPYLPASPL